MPVKSTHSLTTCRNNVSTDTLAPVKNKSPKSTRQKRKVNQDHEEFRLESWSASEVRELLQQTGINDSFNERYNYE